MDYADLTKQLQDAGLGDYVGAIMAYAQPCVRLHARRAEADTVLPLGATRIGGLPDMPPSVEWLGQNGKAFEFIAQINLSEVAPYDATGLLPDTGLLLFFFDIDDEYIPGYAASTTILYYTGDMTVLERAADYPPDLEGWHRWKACTVTIENDWILPAWGNAAFFEMIPKVFHCEPEYEPEAPSAKAYVQLSERRLIPNGDSDKHHMLGYAQPIIQEDPLYEVPGAWNSGDSDYNDAMREWLLLLQISSNDESKMFWHDTSSLYYMIRKEDLIARRFENAICILQFM